MRRTNLVWAAALGAALIACAARGAQAQGLRAGAAAVEITPKTFPRIVSGGFLQAAAGRANDPLYARCLVLDDGACRLAIVVVDTLMMPRALVDAAKRQASQATGIPIERMLVSATHTHSAPSVMGALGTPVDAEYAALLPGWIAASVQRAAGHLAPAAAGWAVVDAPLQTNCRRWIKRPDRIGTDPFGNATVRAMMHPGYQNPDYVGPAGPEDAGLTLLAVYARGAGARPGRPLALLANYSMHYFGAAPVSADYFGRFCRRLPELIGAGQLDPPVVAVMSQGTAGDLHWMDYSRPHKPIALDAYADEVAKRAAEAYAAIAPTSDVPLKMAERRLTLRRRTPDAARLAWAAKVVEGMKGRTLPNGIPEVYALEQFLLRDDPQCELRLQALRVGDLGITAIPCEVYGITGLKLKLQSPLAPTMNFELANGADGYIPPPEQHALGGYTTWPARTAGLEVQAEPQIVETTLQLLEEVAGKPRRKAVEPAGRYVAAVLASKPAAYWRLGDLTAPRAEDASGHGAHAAFEDGAALFLDGTDAAGVAGPGQTGRAAHLAGGRIVAALPKLGGQYSVEFWFWNGLPCDARPVTGYLVSRGVDGAKGAPGDHLGLGGTHAHAGRLFFYNGDEADPTLAGGTEIPLRTWQHVVLVRQGDKVAVYLNGGKEPEIAGAARAVHGGAAPLFLGGRSDRFAGWEGKLDEAAVYDRPLSPDEIAAHYAAACL